jgi:hypothetical protein
MSKLLELEQKFDEFAAEARFHWSRDEERMRLIDQFVNPQMQLEHLLTELFKILQEQREALGKLSTAIELQLSDPARDVQEAREVNGRREGGSHQ